MEKKNASPPKKVTTKHHVYEAYIFSWPRQVLITDENHSALGPGGVQKEKGGEELKKQGKPMFPMPKSSCSTCIFHKVSLF